MRHHEAAYVASPVAVLGGLPAHEQHVARALDCIAVANADAVGIEAACRSMFEERLRVHLGQLATNNVDIYCAHRGSVPTVATAEENTVYIAVQLNWQGIGGVCQQFGMLLRRSGIVNEPELSPMLLHILFSFVLLTFESGVSLPM